MTTNMTTDATTEPAPQYVTIDGLTMLASEAEAFRALAARNAETWDNIPDRDVGDDGAPLDEEED